MVFDEQSMFKTTPNLIKMLISTDKESAKDYLKNKARTNLDELLSEFGQYTIEALIVYVLCMVFTSSSNSMIRVASLVEQLDSNVRLQAVLLKGRRCKQSCSIAQDEVKQSDGKGPNESKLEKMYPFGTRLVEFMEERGMITLITDLSGSVRVQKKQGHYYLPSTLYAVCNFDIALLPIKFNLPMVCKPVDWKSACGPGQQPRTLSDLSGGYLSGLTGEIYSRYSLLSSGKVHHFYIDLGSDCTKLCGVMNKLQGQAFQIHSDWLQYLLSNEDIFVKLGLLMPRCLSNMNHKEVSILLRECYMKDEVLHYVALENCYIRYIRTSSVLVMRL